MKSTSGAIKIIFCLSLLLPSFGYAEEHLNREAGIQNNGVESLSSDLRELLKKEMSELEKAMLAIFPAYVSGDWEKIEAIAKEMKNSYILKQSLSEKQLHELHSSLPPSFIELDQQFHYLAGMLEHVAERKKPELVGFYFSRLSESCMGCHTLYATHRFPAFISGVEKHRH